MKTTLQRMFELGHGLAGVAEAAVLGNAWRDESLVPTTAPEATP